MKKYIISILILSQSFIGFSNNIQVSNISVNGSFCVFDLSWDNSWNDATNHDAAWVFIKFRYPSPDWSHAILDTTGHELPAGCLSTVASDGMGIFLYRSQGVGNNNFQDIRLSWNLAASGLSSTDSVQIRIFAVEMVYVPEGPFYVGDGSSAGCFRQVSTNTPALISTEPIIIKCNGTSYDDAQLEGSGILVDGNGGIDKDGFTAVDNPNYPTGYKAFYCMKYEISQGQYADFLNTLTAAQFTLRYYSTTQNRYTISGTRPYMIATSPDLSCNWINYTDGCAYADWSGLRPMTELEYEKACRGPLSPVAGEYAWGTATIANTAYVLINSGNSDEMVTNLSSTSGNAAYNLTDANISGPVRCGIFAASQMNGNRISSGATFYGIMEMSGNNFEQCVTLGNSNGRNFTGIHGNGAINGNGNANVDNWPGMVSGEIVNANGGGMRGDDWESGTTGLRISDRSSAASTDNVRNNSVGFRAVRNEL